MAIKIPLAARLKKESYKKIAFAQDIILKEVYGTLDKPVLHGGTAIWRCFSGKRFSEDLDFYFQKEIGKIDMIFSELQKKGFIVQKKKISENSVFSELMLERISVRLEATFQKIKGTLADYENIDGTFTPIYSLTPEAFIKEKVETYLKRKKIRDLFDIYFLSGSVTYPSEILPAIKRLIQKYEFPVDEQNLKAILFEGITPSSKEMLEYLKRKWQK